ncbi:thioredoxin [Pseudomonas sp. 21C1]|nr:thioredoxin [Pseudomonas sp. 21C1]
MIELFLSDFDADHQLLALGGTTLLVFVSQGCAHCRFARQRLPSMLLPVSHLAWIDAGESPGLVQRYEVFHLPALFVVRDGYFHGALHARLSAPELSKAVGEALARPAEELP